jgi:penicillin-binding protein 2
MSGLVPSREWKAKTFRSRSDKRWYDGETLNVSIGQGFLLATPLQLARAYAAIVNGGRLMQPYLIEAVEPPDGGPDLFRREPLEEQSLSNQAALKHIKEGLRQVIEATTPFHGTGWQAKNKLVPLIGKTGTAQVAGFKERADTKEKLKRISYKKRDHAWFVALMDEGEEPLVIFALCEHGGHASETAVPAVREVAKRIYNLMLERTGNTKEEETNA